jgi:nucleoside-diphosphate-sugar epimerase
MIYGTHRDRNLGRLVRFLTQSPIIPVLGNGEYLMQPVHVDDLARAIVLVLDEPVTVRRAYNLAGHMPLTYNEIVRITSLTLGRKPWIWHLPSRPLVGLLRRIEWFGIRLRIKAEQVERLNEHKAFPWEEAARDFAYAPRAFADGIRQEIEEMGIPVSSGRR